MFAYVLALVIALSWSALALRMWIREFLHERRVSKLGEQQWYEVQQESARKVGPYGPSSFDGVRSISQFLNDFHTLSFRKRPRVTFVWLRDAEDGDHLTRLYVGVNEGAGEAGRFALSAYAQSIGARLRPVSEVAFPTENIVVAYRDRVAPAQASDTIDEIGVVANAIAAVANEARMDDTSAVFVTLDGMGKSEHSNLNDALMSSVIKKSGNSSMFASTAARALGVMTDNAVRVGLAAATTAGDERTSTALLRAATSATSTFGYQVNVMNPLKVHMRTCLIYGVAAATPLVLMMLFGAHWAGAVGIAVMVGAAIATLKWYDAFWGPLARAAQQGNVLLPEFLPRPLSLRRGIETMWLRFSLRGHESDRENVKVRPVGYPSPDEVLTAHPAALMELVSFSPTATLTAVDRVQSRGLPPNMVDVEDGIFLGLDGLNQPVFLDIDDIHYSLYTAGAPNSGKSNLLLVLYAGMVKAAIEHTAGLSLSPIWGETKGEGAYDAWKIARHCPGAIFVDVHNPLGNARLALEGRRLSEGETVPNVLANCTRLVSSLQAAYGDGIKSQAREIFDNVLRCAMLMTSDEIQFAELSPFVNPLKPNIMELAFYLLLGDANVDPSGKMINLGGTLSRSTGLREQELSRAIGAMSRFWDSSQRRTYLERVSTVLNKLNDMRNAPMLWNPDHRTDVYIGHLVQAFAPSVVNMGSFYDANTRQFSQSIDRALSQRLIRSFNYLLWEYIKGRCNGWQAERKRVPMFFDEVADVAANATGDDVPNTLEEGTKEGRSRGAAYFLGSQYPSQMPDMVRHQVLASRGKFWFGLQNSTDLDLAVHDLMVDDVSTDGAITASNIKSLTNGACFATVPRAGSVSPPLLLQVAYAPTWARMLFAPENSDTNDAVADYIDQVGREREAAR